MITNVAYSVVVVVISSEIFNYYFNYNCSLTTVCGRGLEIFAAFAVMD